MKPHLVPSLILFLALGACTAEQEPNNKTPGKTPDQQPSSQPAAKENEAGKPVEASAEKPKAKENPEAKTKVEDIDAAGAAKLIASDPSILILDIRTPREYERGHIKGAVLVNYSDDDFAAQLEKLDKSKTCLVH